MRDIHKCDWSTKIKAVLVVLLVVLAGFGILEPHLVGEADGSWTLISRLRYYLDGEGSSLINWTEQPYYGLIFGKATKQSLAKYIDSLNNGSYNNYLDILRWSARCHKLGIESEQAIIDALGNVTLVGDALPKTVSYNGPCFLIYDRDVLWSCLYFGAKYGLTSKWNITKAYNYFVSCLANGTSYYTYGLNLTSALWWHNDGTAETFTDRFYDENAQTLSAYLIFYELGATEALLKAQDVWKYLVDYFWNNNMQGFMYQINDPDWECEGAFFPKILFSFFYYNHSNPDAKLLTDIYSRFLRNKWNSPQWRNYAIVHATTNSQTRLWNTLGAWTAMYESYELLNSSGQSNLRDMSMETWYRLYQSDLYDNSSSMFKNYNTDETASSTATCACLVLQLIGGISPYDTSLAFPLEELHCEYTYDVDPDLLEIDVVGNTLKLAVQKYGTLKLIFGGNEVYCTFPSSGIYSISFNAEWTSILGMTKVSSLPTDRKYVFTTSRLAGDITGAGGKPDGKVDVRDVALVASLYGVSSSDPRYNAKADIVNDGKIDVRDVSLVSASYGAKTDT